MCRRPENISRYYTLYLGYTGPSLTSKAFKDALLATKRDKYLDKGQYLQHSWYFLCFFAWLTVPSFQILLVLKSGLNWRENLLSLVLIIPPTTTFQEIAEIFAALIRFPIFKGLPDFKANCFNFKLIYLTRILTSQKELTNVIS